MCSKFPFLLLTFALAVLFAQAQTAKTASDDKANDQTKGSITGQLTAEDGQSLDDVTVELYPVNSPYWSSTQSVSTDASGKFRFDKVKTGLYRITAYIPSFTLPEPDRFNTVEKPKLYRIGDNVNLTFIKGAVITGIATNSEGEPMIGVRVRAVRVRDANRQKLLARQGNTNSWESYTDDRGIYRIFGIPAGAYLVSVGDSNNGNYAGEISNSGILTYHPTDTIDTAEEVFVAQGQEANGIDIRSRGEIGHVVSGSVTGLVKAKEQWGNRAQIVLFDAKSKRIQNRGETTEKNGVFTFKIEKIADGNYLAAAVQYPEEHSGLMSDAQKVEVKGGDVTGLEFKLSLLGAIGGKLVVEKNPTLSKNPECANQKTFASEEIGLGLLTDTKKAAALSVSDFDGNSAIEIPDEKSVFDFKLLSSAKYHLEPQFLDESLFVKALTAPNSEKNKPAKDVGFDGLTIANGENLSGLTLTISDGAGKISGKIVAKDVKKFDELPEKFIVYLIPNDKDASENSWRYAEVLSAANQSFEFKNVAPASYFLFAEPFKVDKNQPNIARQPNLWDNEKRTKLKDLAKQSNITLTIAPCQNLKDQKFPFTANER